MPIAMTSDSLDAQYILDELEGIYTVLQRQGAASSPQVEQQAVPTLDQVVGHSALPHRNHRNPFLSGETLEALVKQRNEAERVAAQAQLNASARRAAAQTEQTFARLGIDEHRLQQDLARLQRQLVEQLIKQQLPLLEQRLRQSLTEKIDLYLQDILHDALKRVKQSHNLLPSRS